MKAFLKTSALVFAAVLLGTFAAQFVKIPVKKAIENRAYRVQSQTNAFSEWHEFTRGGLRLRTPAPFTPMPHKAPPDGMILETYKADCGPYLALLTFAQYPEASDTPAIDTVVRATLTDYKNKSSEMTTNRLSAVGNTRLVSGSCVIKGQTISFLGWFATSQTNLWTVICHFNPNETGSEKQAAEFMARLAEQNPHIDRVEF